MKDERTKEEQWKDKPDFLGVFRFATKDQKERISCLVGLSNLLLIINTHLVDLSASFVNVIHGIGLGLLTHDLEF